MAERIQRLIATQKELSSAISHELRTPIARLRFALEMLAETLTQTSASVCGE
ncbi:MAG: histidine kinase dimerization/phospho-acceptor domain-containing protein [Candidatus Accumulibacter contiguus]